MRGKRTNRWLLAACAAVLAALSAEGAYSLCARRSLLDRALGAPPWMGEAGQRADVHAAASPTPGPYARDRDPEVGFHVEPSSTVLFAGVPASTDAHGQRARPGDPPRAGDVRVLLLGDSVAFGYGVSDADAPGAQLERLLAAAGDGETRAVVLTAACPGWNWRNSFRYARDHLERLAPDIVLYLAVGNDLDDTRGVDAGGWHWIDGEPDGSWPACCDEQQIRLIKTMQHLPSRRTLLELQQAGGLSAVEHALCTGVTSESHRRWTEYVAGIAELDAELSAQGADFAVLLPFDGDFYRQLELRLGLEQPQVRQHGLIAGWSHADSLGHDAHSNPEFVRASAWRTASYLLEEGLVPGDAARLEPQVPAYRDRVYVPVAPEERRAALDALLERKGRFLQPVLDLVDVRGTHQVYGGLLGDGSFGRHVYLALRNRGAARLSVVLQREPAVRGLYPLRLEVQVGGLSLGEQEVPAPEPGEDAACELLFHLPAEARARPTLDVCLCASSWVERETVLGPRPVSARLRRVALLDP